MDYWVIQTIKRIKLSDWIRTTKQRLKGTVKLLSQGLPPASDRSARYDSPLMSNPPPEVLRPGLEIVPGYTLISPLGSGMAGDVWQAQAAGGIKVALKVVRNLKDLGGRKELKALKTIRDVHHPNLCPLFGFWTKDAQGRVLADGETEDLTFDSISSSGHTPAPGYGPPPPNSAPPNSADTNSGPSGNASGMDGTMAIGTGMQIPGIPPDPQIPDPVADTVKPAKPKVTAEQLIVVMGLGDCTLYDRLKFVRHEAGLGPEAVDTPYGLDPVETIRYLRASASAIDLLNQEHQIYHCDIKPQNILLVGGEAQVCDFGLAKQMEGDMRQTQQAFATPAYAPPEVLHNEGYSRQVDQYSLAVTYYELRTGLLPFDITTHASMLVAKSTGKLNLDALMPAERKVLQKALRRVPSERFGSCTEFINAIAIASGVDKSGGITVGRIMTAVATILCVAALGVAGWRYADPEGFQSFFFSSEVRIAERLGDAKALYQTTESENFESAQLPLTEVLGNASDIAQKSRGDVQREAEELFSDATMRLLSRIHETLQQAESSGATAMTDGQRNKIESSLGQLTPDRPSPESPIPIALKTWSQNETPQLRAAYNEYLSLYYAAAVRFDLLSGSASAPEIIDGLREALDQRAQDFSTITAIDLTLGSLLPVLGTTPGVDFKTWTARQWLDEPRLADLIRAEKSVRQFGAGSVYSRRWSEIREAFTVAVEPAITGSGPAGGAIPDQTKQKVLAGFPDLEIEKQFAELRESVESLAWTDTDRLLGELRFKNSLTQQQSTLLTSIDALAKNRDKANALELVRKVIDDANISPLQLRELRTQPLFASYMRGIGQRTLDRETQSSDAIHEQMPFARWLEKEVDTPIPNEFLSAAALSLLKLSPDTLANSAADPDLEIGTWLATLEQSQASAALSAAIQIERMIAGGPQDQAAVDSAIKLLQSSDPQYLNLVSNEYANYLAVCGACLSNEDITELAGKMKTSARQSVQSLGNTRLIRGCELLVRHAIDASGVEDDEVVVLRYSAESAPPSKIGLTRSYLSLADFWMDHSDNASLPSLAYELLIQSVASPGAQVSKVDIPSIISDKLVDSKTTAELPTQVLKALHEIGIAKLRDQETSVPRSELQRNEIAMRLVIRPASTMIKRFGENRFGPKTGDSNEKRILLKSILVPAADQAVVNLFRFADGSLLPLALNADAKQHLPEIAEFCQLATSVLADPMAMPSFGSPESFRRQCIAAAAVASTKPSILASEKQQLLMRVAECAIAIHSLSGDELLNAATNASRYGAGIETVEYLRSEAHERTARTLHNRSDKAAELEKALSSAEMAMQAFEKLAQLPEIGQKQRYEVLAKCADLGVQLAFLRSRIDDKLELLRPALRRGDQAIAAYVDDWGDEVNFPIVSTYLSKGNACEDIAHYCLIGDDPETISQREKHFQLAIEAFREARDRNFGDFKTRFSLARCQYRYAITLEGAAKDRQLANATDALGNTPQQADANAADLYRLSTMAEWFLWKIIVEAEQKNLNEAIQLAKFAFQFVRNEEIPIDIRNVLSKECGVVYGKNKQWDQAAETLMYLEGQGPTIEVIRRMGTVSDIAFRRLSSDEELFTKLIKILYGLPKLGSLDDDGDATYALAKIATRCMREQVVGLSAGRSARSTNTKVADLSRGVRAFMDQLNPNSGGEYLELAKVFQQGDVAAQNLDADEMFRFACDLSLLMKSHTETPSYIESNCCLIVFHSLAYWGTQTGELDDDAKQTAQLKASGLLTKERRDAVLDCLEQFKGVAEGAKDTKLTALTESAIAMIQDLKNTEP